MTGSTRVFAAVISGVSLLAIGLRSVKADTLAGPSSWDVSGGGDTTWGIQFTALTNSTLTGFDFNHKDNSNVSWGSDGLTGNIYLNDITTSATVFSAAYGTFPSPALIPFTGLNIALTAGNQYQLVADAAAGYDEVFQYNSLYSPAITYPTSDSQISVTQGVFNSSAWEESNCWGAFNNITTTGTTVSVASTPEPGVLAMIAGLGIPGAAFLRRRRAR